ncbi:hypothetical protein GpartN1_g5824.t1 [Galdieria partita]|uniref:Uncharacterized protein n=1 Tax=Galdieria partita TaxID=83374 RepID=A0A9C7USP0_9RHOD|nr:hypothetical protein GpartN1_g5824.t1 [Galdieria partita]
MMTSPVKKKKGHYHFVTPEDIRLFKRLNSNIRIRDEYRFTPSPASIPMFSSNSEYNTRISSSEMNTNELSKNTTKLDSETSELVILRKTMKRKTNLWQYLSRFLFKIQSLYKSEEPSKCSKVARKLSFQMPTQRGWMWHILQNIAAILRTFMAFILFCLVLSSTSYSFGDIYSECGKLTSGIEYFCHPNISTTSIYPVTCKEDFIMIASIECIPNNSSNRMLVELYNVALHILKTQWNTQCSLKGGFRDLGMTMEQLQQAILSTSSYQNTNEISEIFEKLPYYLSKTSGIVWKTTTHQPILYYYVLPWNVLSWKCWFGIQSRQHWLFAAILASISQFHSFHFRCSYLSV